MITYTTHTHKVGKKGLKIANKATILITLLLTVTTKQRKQRFLCLQVYKLIALRMENKKMKQKNFEGKGPCSASPVLPSLPSMPLELSKIFLHVNTNITC